MCDPINIGIASLIGSAAATAGSLWTQHSAQQSSDRASAAWRDYQAKQRAAETQRQEDLRLKAEAARTNTLDQMTAAKEQKAQTQEEARLNEAYNAPTQPTAQAGDQLLEGTAQGGDAIKEDFAKKLATASQDARRRISALATINSYGDSFGGLGTRNAETLAAGDQRLNLINNMRQGSLSAYNIAKGVNPINLPNQTDMFGGVASTLAGIAGAGLGKAYRDSQIMKA